MIAGAEQIVTATEEREKYEALAAKLRYQTLLHQSAPTSFFLDLMKIVFAELQSGLEEARPIDSKAVAILTASMQRAEQKTLAHFRSFTEGVSAN
jgi:hypothetical protein